MNEAVVQRTIESDFGGGRGLVRVYIFFKISHDSKSRSEVEGVSYCSKGGFREFRGDK